MIVEATHDQGLDTTGTGDATKVRPDAFFDVRFDPGSTVFRRENDVAMQSGIGVGHGTSVFRGSHIVKDSGQGSFDGFSVLLRFFLSRRFLQPRSNTRRVRRRSATRGMGGHGLGPGVETPGDPRPSLRDGEGPRWFRRQRCSSTAATKVSPVRCSQNEGVTTPPGALVNATSAEHRKPSRTSEVAERPTPVAGGFTPRKAKEIPDSSIAKDPSRSDGGSATREGETSTREGAASRRVRRRSATGREALMQAVEGVSRADACRCGHE